MSKNQMPAAMAIAGTLVLGLAGPAYGDVTDDLLRQLLAKGVLTQQEYNALLERKAEEEKREVETQVRVQPPTSPAQAIDPDTMVQMTDSGVGMRVGEVEIKFSGSINGYYVQEWGDDNPGTVVGGLAGAGDSAAIRNGLLPGFFKVDVTTNQGGWDVGAHFGMYPGINSVSNVGGANSAGNPTALGTSGIDFRQTYLTFGRPELGEIKIGRDIGLFGSEAILNDITLLSVGTAGGNAAPSNTSLGRIGLGYVYTDFQPQITYTTPSFGGFQAAVGVFQPLVTAGGNEVNDEPGFQAELTYDLGAAGFGGGLGGKLWASVITQQHDPVGATPGYRGTGYDVGAKLTFGPASATGYYYTGEGLGTTGLFILATDAAGNERDSDGFYIQGAYEVLPKLTLAASYGESRLDLAPGEVNPTLLDVNKSWVGQVQYGLTDWVTLIGEYINTTSEAQNGAEVESDALAVGAILFF